QGGGKHRALTHAVRITFGQIVDEVVQVEELDHLVDSVAAIIDRQTVHIRDELQEFTAGQLLVEVRQIGNIADELASLVTSRHHIETADTDRTGRGEEQTAY